MPWKTEFWKEPDVYPLFLDLHEGFQEAAVRQIIYVLSFWFEHCL